MGMREREAFMRTPQDLPMHDFPLDQVSFIRASGCGLDGSWHSFKLLSPSHYFQGVKRLGGNPDQRLGVCQNCTDRRHIEGAYSAASQNIPFLQGSELNNREP